MSHLSSPRRRAVAGFAAVSAGTAMAAVALAGPAGAGDDPVPERVEGNPTCEDLGYDNGFKIEGLGELPDEGTYTSDSEGVDTEGDADGFEVTIVPAGAEGEDAELDQFHANHPVSVVMIKAGPGANVYEFDPAVADAHNLYSDRDSISHITFCWNGEIPGDEDEEDESTTTTTAPDESDDEDEQDAAAQTSPAQAVTGMPNLTG